MNAATTTRHRLLMTDVNLVQVNYTRLFVWMDHGFTQLLHDLNIHHRHCCARDGLHRSSMRIATTSGP
jgi:hypothetical protein